MKLIALLALLALPGCVCAIDFHHQIFYARLLGDAKVASLDVTLPDKMRVVIGGLQSDVSAQTGNVVGSVIEGAVKAFTRP